ncbi:hypothetical protein EON71_00430 [bacterium]|nr:MAG: hypothetical protein EON71_00430 [bacterium]
MPRHNEKSKNPAIGPKVVGQHPPPEKEVIKANDSSLPPTQQVREHIGEKKISYHKYRLKVDLYAYESHVPLVDVNIDSLNNQKIRHAHMHFKLKATECTKISLNSLNLNHSGKHSVAKHTTHHKEENYIYFISMSITRKKTYEDKKSYEIIEVYKMEQSFREMHKLLAVFFQYSGHSMPIKTNCVTPHEILPLEFWCSPDSTIRGSQTTVDHFMFGLRSSSITHKFPADSFFNVHTAGKPHALSSKAKVVNQTISTHADNINNASNPAVVPTSSLTISNLAKKNNADNTVNNGGVNNDPANEDAVSIASSNSALTDGNVSDNSSNGEFKIKP